MQGSPDQGLDDLRKRGPRMGKAEPGAGVSPVSLSFKPSLDGGLGGLAQINFHPLMCPGGIPSMDRRTLDLPGPGPANWSGI